MSPRPYDGGKRRADAERTRERILDAAADMLAQGGGTGFSLEAVARRAGVARMTVYYQFGSRAGLLEAAFDRRAARSRIAAEAPAAFGAADPREGVRHVVSIFCDFWGADAAGMRGLNVAGDLDPEMAESLRARNERRRIGLRRLVERMAARRPAELTDALFMLTGASTYAALEPGRTPAEVETLIQELAAGALDRLA